MKLCLPANFNKDTLEKLSAINNQKEIYEVYGNLNPSPLLNSGRGRKDSDVLPKVDIDTLKEYIEEAGKLGLHFDYTLNPSCISNIELQEKGRICVLDFVQQLYDIGVRQLTVAMPTLIEIIKEKFPDMGIRASTIIGIDSVKKAKFYESIGCSRLVLKEDINRDFRLMEKISKAVNIPIEVIVNTHCQFDCPLRQFHYNALSHDSYEDTYNNYFEQSCRRNIFEDGLKIRWIRPEDIKYYEEVGIEYFKIIGRAGVSNQNLVKTCQCYMDRRFDGNYLELFNNFPEGAKIHVNLDNRKLDGFIEHFLNSKLNCFAQCGTECNYCKEYLQKVL